MAIIKDKKTLIEASNTIHKGMSDLVDYTNDLISKLNGVKEAGDLHLRTVIPTEIKKVIGNFGLDLKHEWEYPTYE